MNGRLPLLGDGVVLLRAWALDDAMALLAGCREPDINHWYNLPSPYRYGNAVAWISDAEAAWSEGHDAYLAVTDAAMGEVVGAASLLGVDAAESHGRLSCWVRGARRRRGVARRALSFSSAVATFRYSRCA